MRVRVRQLVSRIWPPQLCLAVWQGRRFVRGGDNWDEADGRLGGWATKRLARRCSCVDSESNAADARMGPASNAGATPGMEVRRSNADDHFGSLTAPTDFFVWGWQQWDDDDAEKRSTETRAKGRAAKSRWRRRHKAVGLKARLSCVECISMSHS